MFDFLCAMPFDKIQHHRVHPHLLEMVGIEQPLAQDGGEVFHCRKQRQPLTQPRMLGPAGQTVIAQDAVDNEIEALQSRFDLDPLRDQMLANPLM